MRTLAALLSAMTAAIVVSVAVAATSLDPKTLVLQRSDVPAGLKVA